MALPLYDISDVDGAGVGVDVSRAGGTGLSFARGKVGSIYGIIIIWPARGGCACHNSHSMKTQGLNDDRVHGIALEALRVDLQRPWDEMVRVKEALRQVLDKDAEW
jgi:hypothetical protein